METCQVCNSPKVFRRDLRRKSGGYYRCKKCDARHSSKWRKNNPTLHAQNNKNWRDSNQERISNYKKEYAKTPEGRFQIYRQGAKRRGIPFELNLDEFKSFWQRPCTYCKDPIDTIGLDRIDSQQGYKLDNCTPCCYICNTAKWEMSIKQFFAWVKKVYQVSINQ